MKRYHSTRLSTDAKIRMKQAHAQQDMEDERVTPEMFDSMTAGQGGTDEAPASADAVPEGETSGTASDFIPGDMDQEQTDDGYFEDIEDITDEEPDHDEDDAFDSEDIIIEEDD